MSDALLGVVFAGAATVSLSDELGLGSRLERVGARLGFTEALLGVLAALAADAPEITAAVTALVGHQARIGAGVVIGQTCSIWPPCWASQRSSPAGSRCTSA